MKIGHHHTPSRSTLSEVAELAGVSPSTVSRILNGTAGVSEAKKARVEQAIAQLNFRPNPSARSLAGGRTMSIGVLTQSIDSPFYGEALRGIEQVLLTAGYASLFMSGHWNEGDELQCIRMLQDRQVDGIIVLTGKLPDDTLMSISEQIPLVVTGRQISGEHLCSFDFDNREGLRLAVRHLHALGHRHLAFIASQEDHADTQQRMRGFREELDQLGLPFNEQLVVHGDLQEPSGFRAMNQLIQSGESFTAVIAANDQMAYGAMVALYRSGIRVPDDVSLVGFDDLPHSAFCIPPLTTVRQPIHELGMQAAQAMLMLLKGEKHEVGVASPQLMVRESTRLKRS
jgi:LacI family transcriptional regulator